MSTLKPCPCCRGEARFAEMFRNNETGTDHFGKTKIGERVTCSKCGMTLKKVKNAIIAWNTRTGDTEAAEDHNRLVRELDVLINGEDGAAKQASLCDIVGQLDAQIGAGKNGCMTQAQNALRYLSKNPRPVGGQDRYNAEHLLQIADELPTISRPSLPVMPIEEMLENVLDNGPVTLQMNIISKALGIKTYFVKAINSKTNECIGTGTKHHSLSAAIAQAIESATPLPSGSCNQRDLPATGKDIEGGV